VSKELERENLEKLEDKTTNDSPEQKKTDNN